MKTIRMILLVVVGLATTACVNVQCAAGQDIVQVQEVDPLIGVAVVLVCGLLFLAGLAGLGGGQ